MRYILYCAINKKQLVIDTIYSILTIIYSTKLNYNFKIVIITNQSECFLQVFKRIKFQYMSSIIIEKIDNDIVKKWIGSDNYIFRVKIKAIEYFFNKYKKNVLFLDSDIFALKNILPLFETIESGKCLMYYNYKNIKEHLFYLFEIFKTDKFKLKNMHIYNNEIIVDGFEYSIPCNFSYYASPVIGLMNILVQ